MLTKYFASIVVCLMDGYVRVPPKRLKKLVPKEEYEQFSTRNKFRSHGYLYKRGAHYERKVLHEVIALGGIAVRSTRSLGPFDVWAILNDRLKLIQVKATKGTGKFSVELEELRKIKVPDFCDKELWIWRDRTGWEKIPVPSFVEAEAL